MIEMGDFLPEDEIFQENGATLAERERVLVVGNLETLIGRQWGMFVVSALMQLAPIAEFRFAFADFRVLAVRPGVSVALVIFQVRSPYSFSVGVVLEIVDRDLA